MSSDKIKLNQDESSRSLNAVKSICLLLATSWATLGVASYKKACLLIQGQLVRKTTQQLAEERRNFLEFLTKNGISHSIQEKTNDILITPSDKTPLNLYAKELNEHFNVKLAFNSKSINDVSPNAKAYYDHPVRKVMLSESSFLQVSSRASILLSESILHETIHAIIANSPGIDPGIAATVAGINSNPISADFKKGYRNYVQFDELLTHTLDVRILSLKLSRAIQRKGDPRPFTIRLHDAIDAGVYISSYTNKLAHETMANLGRKSIQVNLESNTVSVQVNKQFTLTIPMTSQELRTAAKQYKPRFINNNKQQIVILMQAYLNKYMIQSGQMIKRFGVMKQMINAGSNEIQAKNLRRLSLSSVQELQSAFKLEDPR